MFHAITTIKRYPPSIFSLLVSSNTPFSTTPPLSNGQAHLNQIYSINGWSAQYIVNAELIVDRYISKGNHQQAIIIRHQYEKRLVEQFGENSEQYNQLLYDDVTRWSLIGKETKVQETYEKILDLVQKYPQLRHQVKQNHNLQFIAAKFMATRGMLTEALLLMNKFKARFPNFETNEKLSDVIRFGYYMQFASIAERLGNKQQVDDSYAQVMKLMETKKVKQVAKSTQRNAIILYAKWLISNNRQSFHVVKQLEGCLNTKNRQHLKVIGLLNGRQAEERNMQDLMSQIQQVLENKRIGK